RSTGAPAVEEAERLVETRVAHEPERGIEVTLALARETYYEVGRDADVRPHPPQFADFLFKFNGCVAALHERENPVGAALHRQVQVVGELGHVRVSLDQAVRELDRM